jgi:hypothetical protein
MAFKVQNSKWLSSECFQAVFELDFYVLFYVWFLIFIQPTNICYNAHFPVLIVVFRQKNKEKWVSKDPNTETFWADMPFIVLITKEKEENPNIGDQRNY